MYIFVSLDICQSAGGDSQEDGNYSMSTFVRSNSG